jgi:hypothetical protein
MSDTPDSLMRRAALAACLACMLAGRAAAQEPAPPTPAVIFLPRVDLHLAANSLFPGDEHFSWDGYLGGGADLFDYRFGRLSALADYHVVLGDEFRAFDPNQAYYTLETAASYRLRRVELVAFFHHVSRHLSDRPKPFSIAWNVAGIRVLHQLSAGGIAFDLSAEGGGVTQYSNVDYRGTGGFDVMARRPINPRLAAYVHVSGELFTVGESLSNRGTQFGNRFEAGVRINGRAGVLELFLGEERRIDADPLEVQTRTWGLAGFRLMNR